MNITSPEALDEAKSSIARGSGSIRRQIAYAVIGFALPRVS